MSTKTGPPHWTSFREFAVRLFRHTSHLIEQDYACKQLYLPHKKPQKKELTPEQKEENPLLARERIIVEHSIAGLKRYRILSDRLRLHDLDLYNQILGVCAGLWNFRLSC